jgi:vacuolar-type H+-ATPase subunit E/Vma4
MAAPKPNSPEALSEEILAEARRECDDIIRRARDGSASLLAAAKTEAETICHEKRASAQAAAARRTELMLATVPVEAGRLRSERIESVLESIREDAQRRLLARDFDYHETLVTLAADAIHQMAGSDFILKISTADHAAFGGKLIEEIAQRTGRSPLKLTISADPAMTDGGVIVQDAAGLRVWDNRLLSRLERLWPELRRQIAIQTSLVAQGEIPEALSDLRQRPEVRQPSAALASQARGGKAAAGCRSPKPDGGPGGSGKGDT